MYDAIYVVSRALDHRKGRKIIVLITDGEDVDSRIEYKQALRAAEEAEALIYSVIIVPIEASAGREIGGEHALIQLSEDTGGRSTTTRPQRYNSTRLFAKSATNCVRNICWLIIRRNARRSPSSAGSRSNWPACRKRLAIACAIARELLHHEVGSREWRGQDTRQADSADAEHNTDALSGRNRCL